MSPIRALLILAWVGMNMGCTVASGVPASTGSATERPMQRIGFSPVAEGKFRATVATKELVLESPDNAQHPTVWDSALQVTDTRTKQSCATEQWLVVEVYAPRDAAVAIIVSYSGSMSYINFVDLETCKPKYPRLEVYSESIQVSYNQIAIFPGCECTDAPANTACQCQAARVYRLGPDYRPVLDGKESLSLTQRHLGVAFTGEGWVYKPKTAQARLLPGRP